MMQKFRLQEATIIIWLAAIWLVAATGTARAEPLDLTDKDNGRTVTVQVGQNLTVNLRHPGSGGYSFLAPEFDRTVLKLVEGHRLPASEPRRMGDFGRMVYEFQALRAGQTPLIIPIKRPWEKEPQTYLRVTIQVSLRSS